MLAQKIRTKIQSSFESQGLMRSFDARISEIEEGHVTIQAPILPLAQQQHGFAHAGMTFALGDTAAGYSALSLMPETADVLTAEMKINLLAPGKGDILIARGRVIKPGRRLFVAAADVFARTGDKEVLIASLMGTLVPML